MPLAELFALAAAVLLLYVLYLVLKTALRLLINSLAGLAAILLINAAFGLGVKITLLSVAVVALCGLPGALIVVAIHLLGLGF